VSIYRLSIISCVDILQIGLESLAHWVALQCAVKMKNRAHSLPVGFKLHDLKLSPWT
jgi:hypothetical protein